MNNKSKQEVIAPFKKHETDSGSSSVQVAILTARISELTEHLKKFKKRFCIYSYSHTFQICAILHLPVLFNKMIDKKNRSVLRFLINAVNVFTHNTDG